MRFIDWSIDRPTQFSRRQIATGLRRFAIQAGYLAIVASSKLSTSRLTTKKLFYPLCRMSVHPVAQAGFGSDSSNYDSVRPDHQPPAVAKLLESLEIPPEGRIVEIGSGTGKFTAHLINRPENWEIICVEPSPVTLPPRIFD
jgi:hypothetical protein